jgi:hypothetical protein
MIYIFKFKTTSNKESEGVPIISTKFICGVAWWGAVTCEPLGDKYITALASLTKYRQNNINICIFKYIYYENVFHSYTP